MAGPGAVSCTHQFQTAISARGEAVRTTVFVADGVPAVLSSATSYALGLLIRPDDDPGNSSADKETHATRTA